MRRAFRLAYDGRPFYGFQRQPDVPTVEDALFDALRDLDAFAADADGADRPEGYAAAGRTDAGVSARAQTVAFEAPDWLTPGVLNAELPASIRAWAGAEVGPEFHATHDARERTYVYHLYAPRTTSDASDGNAPGRNVHDDDTVHAGFDDDRARAALNRLAGEHDFHNLTPDGTGTVRDLSVSADRDGEFLVITLRAGGFARQLVRRVVSLVREVGSGEAALSKVDRVLGPDPLDGPEGVAPAPAEALVLWDVAYPEVAFTVDADAAESARTVFGESRVTHLTAARVAGSIEGRLDEA